CFTCPNGVDEDWLDGPVAGGTSTTPPPTSQPPGVVLNPNGTSTIGGMFDTTGWTVTQGPGTGTHMGDDYYADDLARGCGQTAGQNLYAGISGIADVTTNSDYGNTLVIY